MILVNHNFFALVYMYGNTNYDKKKEQWSFIHEISKANRNPWIALGDLNFHLVDKDTGASSSADGLVNSVVSDSGLDDIRFVCKDFTWTSKNLGTNSKKSIIDMALGNGEWNVHFPIPSYFI